MIHVRVRLFAVLCDACGVDRLDLDLPDGATSRQAVEAAVARHPALSAWLARCGVAVNQEYVGESVGLREGDEIALIPPVSGG